MGGRDVKEMRALHNARYADLIGALAEAHGAILLLEENDLEFKRFKSLLEHSVNALLDIIEQNNLTIVGAEQYYEVEMPIIGKMNARIDYVLTNEEGNYLIFDFKWSEGKTYKTKIEQDDALQLAVYRAVLNKYLQNAEPDHKVVFTGYYVLPKHTLYTVCDNLKSENIEVVTAAVETPKDLMALATHSYTYRMNQLREGLIEEGEGMEMADLQYEKDTISQQLYPLKHAYNQEKLKEVSYGKKNIVLKGGLI